MRRRLLAFVGRGLALGAAADGEARGVSPWPRDHPLPPGDRLVLLSLEVWSDRLDLWYAVVYATPEPDGSCHGRRSSAPRDVRPGRHRLP
jgi:hypothetical protein